MSDLKAEIEEAKDAIKITKERVDKLDKTVKDLGTRMTNAETNQANIISLINVQQKQNELNDKRFAQLNNRITDLKQSQNDQLTALLSHVLDIKKEVENRTCEYKNGKDGQCSK